MQNLKILNNKEVKKIMKELKEQYDTDVKLDFAWFKSSKNKIYLLSKKFGDLEDKNLRINNLGMYFGKFEKDGVRLSIEGAQMIKAKKNIVEIEDVDAWIRGEDLEVGDLNLKKYAIIKNGKDVYGAGKYKNGKLLNFTAKDRRIKSLKP
jgi:NOL1/NOP2/fmu family ribosome biogenesis protein